MEINNNQTEGNSTPYSKTFEDNLVSVTLLT